MAIDLLDPIKELDQLRWDAWHTREDAKGKGDQESVFKLTELLTEIHEAREDAVFDILGGLSEKLGNFASRLAKITAQVENSPLGGTKEHEKQFHDQNLPDNDFDDEGPDSAPTQPAPVPADKVPAVSAGWAENYNSLWKTMTVSDEWASKAVKIAKDIVSAQSKYAGAVVGTNVPWWFIGVVHSMECGLNFTTHLHNGDELTGRTHNVPSGRPPVIQGLPIDWVYSARDAITYEKLDKIVDWSLPSVLYHWHRYNGINNEYKARRIPTPYLWSGSQHYIKGKYDRDGHFNPSAVSKQVGAAVLLWALIKINAVALGGTGSPEKKNTVADVPTPVSNPAAAGQHVASLDLDLSGTPFKHLAEELNFPGSLKVGSSKKASIKRVQEWLNLHGFVTSIDGDFGASTEKQLGRFASANGRPAVGELDDELWAILTSPLRKALAPIQASPSLEESVVKVARQHIAAMPTEVGGNNCGPWVRAYMRGKEGEDWKWCGGFVSFMIEQATRDLGVEIKFNRQVGVDELVSDAKGSGRFIHETEVLTPLLRQSKISPGYLFVVRKSETDWTHVGIVSSVMSQTFDTLEGNTGGDGGTDGANARAGNRGYPGRDFIRLL